MSDFVHLHVHSEYSLLDGLVKIPKLIEKAQEYAMPAVALTDHGVMYGAFQFYKTAVKAGIKPIVGMEAYLTPHSRHDRKKDAEYDRSHVTLLAMNEIGYKNLIKLTTIGHLEGFYYKPRIDFETLEKYKEGLICLSGCPQSMVNRLIRDNRMEEAGKTLRRFLDLFGDNYYIEVMRHPKLAGQEELVAAQIKLSQQYGIPIVATNDVHYLNPDDAYAQEILLCIQTQRTILEKNRKLSMLDSPDFYFRSPEEMIALFMDHPEAIENTLAIAERCNLTLKIGDLILPHFPTPPGHTSEEYLKKMTYERFPTRFKEMTEEHKTRLDYELDVICKKGYATYFLIVQDFVNHAKNTGIAVGPGRGSVAGSLVAYVLHITDIDPLQWKIPFERFLNPHRPSPPDIDLDFADDRRDEVIQYVTERYGSEKVAQIITFGTMEARGAVRDAGRALGMPYSQPDRIARMIPVGSQGFSMTLDRALKESPELSASYANESETRKLIDLAKKLEGIARHASVHAAGVVIADKALTDYVPLQRESRNGKIVTQFDMYSLDLNAVPDGMAVGLLKMDFLGLRNLSILEKSIRLAEEIHGAHIDLHTLSVDDPESYALIARGENVGLFQLESAGMQRLGRSLKPTKFSDISAMVALYRPGPMAWIDDFITAKANPQKIRYPHADLKPILAETYGIAVYQEQCMQIANAMAGYSMAEADGLRRAIGKKKKDLMEKEKKKFIKGCVAKGYSEKTAVNVFSLIEKFVGYGFNKAHSASYAMIAYWTAYMKAHYPVEFMTALLTAESESTSGPIRDEKVRRAVDECGRMKIHALPPDINRSNVEFSVEEKKDIRFGLSAVKNVGRAAIETILAARANGAFESFNDFCERIDLSKVNKKTMESLIKVGAFDSFGKRAALLSALPEIVSQAQKTKQQLLTSQTSLFVDDSTFTRKPVLPDIEEFSRRELLTLERDLLGVYLTDHPLSRVMKQVQSKITHTIAELDPLASGTNVTVAGMIVRIKPVITRRNNHEMAFVTVEDVSGSIEAVVFPTLYSSTQVYWHKDAVLLIQGSIDRRNDRTSLVINKIYPLDV